MKIKKAFRRLQCLMRARHNIVTDYGSTYVFCSDCGATAHDEAPKFGVLVLQTVVVVAFTVAAIAGFTSGVAADFVRVVWSAVS